MTTSLAGVYKMITHMFRSGKQHKPGDMVELSHEEATEALAQGTVKVPSAADQKAASEAAFEKMGAPPEPEQQLGGGSPPEVVEMVRKRAEADRVAAESKPSTETPPAATTETSPEGRGGKKAK